MTIKQQGGVFGRNPSFNEIEANSAVINGEANVRGLLKVSNEHNSNFIQLSSTTTADEAFVKLDDTNLVVDLDPTGTRASSDIIINSDGVTVLTIKNGAAGGDLEPRGNVVLANGQGIDFSATSGTGTSELFDDYEEGTWTPTLAAYGGTPTVSGYYVKIGQVVYVECSITLDGTLDASNYIIDGLPFTMASPQLGGGAVNTNDGGVADALVGSDASGRLRLRDSSGTNQTYNSIGVSSTVTLNAQYRAA